MRLQFRVGNGEFGDIYHLLATAVLLHSEDRKIAIKFVEFPNGEGLFSFLGVGIDIGFQGDAEPLGSTANVLLKRFYDGCLEGVEKAIRKAAQERHWPFPHLKMATPDPKLLIWQRSKDYKPYRNSSLRLLNQLVELCAGHATIPVVLGPQHGFPAAEELGDFWKEEFFSSDPKEDIAKQLWFIDTLFRFHGAVAQVGMMSGAMDGPAMIFGHKTIFLARHRDAAPRMLKVSMAVPNLIWQPIEYRGEFQKLSDAQLRELEGKIWPE